MPSSLDGRNYYFVFWAIRKVNTLCLLGIGVEGLVFPRERQKSHEGSRVALGQGAGKENVAPVVAEQGSLLGGDDHSLPLHLTPIF